MSLKKEIIEESMAFVRRNRKLVIENEKAGSYPSPRVSSEFMDCSMPCTFDHYSHCSLGCLYCVPSGTRILMGNGREKVIERILGGEAVIAINEKTGEFEQSQVTATMSRDAQKTVKIQADTYELELTPEHPVMTRNGWIEAGNLKEGDEILVW